MKAGEPGAAIGDSVANTVIDRASVGPEIRCQEDPNRAAITAGTIAV